MRNTITLVLLAASITSAQAANTKFQEPTPGEISYWTGRVADTPEACKEKMGVWARTSKLLLEAEDCVYTQKPFTGSANIERRSSLGTIKVIPTTPVSVNTSNSANQDLDVVDQGPVVPGHLDVIQAHLRHLEQVHRDKVAQTTQASMQKVFTDRIDGTKWDWEQHVASGSTQGTVMLWQAPTTTKNPGKR